MNRQRMNAQQGVTMIELLIAVVVLGLLTAVLGRLTMAGMESWNSGFAQLMMQRKTHYARDVFIRNLRNASASTIAISRTNTAQPYFSMVTFIDGEGNTHQYYQEEKSLIVTISKANKVNREVLLMNNLESLKFYYPNEKDFSVLAFSLYALKPSMGKMLRRPVELLVTANQEIRNP
jgi:prepilin-type N-terminal cleavage/methylation domain-containing protein